MKLICLKNLPCLPQDIYKHLHKLVMKAMFKVAETD